jgi:ABC-type lipoprotein release transport system permease subunit
MTCTNITANILAVSAMAALAPALRAAFVEPVRVFRNE